MELRGTTIIAVQRDGKCAVAGDGQKSLEIASEICVFTNGNIIVEEV